MLKIKDSIDFAAAFEVSRETLDKLKVYESLLLQWQQAINLVAPASLEYRWQRHFADSAQLLAILPENTRRLVDLGSGAGFPGLVLAILAAEGGRIETTLIEADQRKAAFLREVARKAGIAVDIVVSRIENTETQAMVAPADVVTARALAPLNRLFALAKPYMYPHSVGVFLKGRGARQELDEARKCWVFEADLIESQTGGSGSVVVVRCLAAKTEG